MRLRVVTGAFVSVALAFGAAAEGKSDWSVVKTKTGALAFDFGKLEEIKGENAIGAANTTLRMSTVTVYHNTPQAYDGLAYTYEMKTVYADCASGAVRFSNVYLMDADEMMVGKYDPDEGWTKPTGNDFLFAMRWAACDRLDLARNPIAIGASESAGAEVGAMMRLLKTKAGR